jgi:hypothetical protein
MIKINERVLRVRNIIITIYEEEIDVDINFTKDEKLNIIFILNIFHVKLMIKDKNCMQVNYFNEKTN